MENLIGIAVVGAIFVWMTWSRPNKGLEGYSPSQKVCQPAPRPTTEADVVSSSEPASSQPGWLIRTARIAAGSILLVCWPVFTFLLPFLFDDPTGGAVLGRILFIGFYLAYPIVFYKSGIAYKANFKDGRKGIVVVIAFAPLLALTVFLLLALALDAQ